MLEKIFGRNNSKNLSDDPIKEYKKKDLSFPIKTNHPKPFTRKSRYKKEGDFWVKDTGNNTKNKAVMICGGDLMCEPVMSEAAFIDGTYDFNYSFKYIQPILADADFAIANLETIVSERFPYAREIHRVPHHTGTRYHCNAPVEYLDALRYASFDAFALSNNHNLDGGYEGIIDTIDNLDNRHFMRVGLFKNDEESRFLLVRIYDIKVGIFSYTEHINRKLDQELLTAKGQSDLLNKYSREKLEKDIADARRKGAEFILVYIHFLGKDYSHEILPRQVKTAQEIADSGADCIIGTHMHCIQKYDKIKSRDGRIVPVTYSVGNLMTSDNTGSLTKRSFLYKMVLERTDKGIEISEESYIPIRTVEGTLRSNYIVFPTQARYRDNKPSPFLEKEQLIISEEVGDKISLDNEIKKYSKYQIKGSGDTCCILGSGKDESFLVIPESIENKTVVRIENEAFSNSKTEELTLPDSVESIGYAAFYNCKNLSKINFGSGLRFLERSAFNTCKNLTEIVLPENLESIGMRAFRDSGLRDVYIPDSVSSISQDAFQNCNDLVIHCNKGSAAEDFAQKHGFRINHTILHSQPISSSYKAMIPQISIREAYNVLGKKDVLDQESFGSLDLDIPRNVCFSSWSLKEDAIVVISEGRISLTDAINHNAAMIISNDEDKRMPGCCFAKIPENMVPREVYVSLCRHIRKKYDIPCIAVTGNAGKTTTKDLIGRTLSSMYDTLYVNKNYNTYYTCGEILQNLSKKHEMYVQEIHEPHAELCSNMIEQDVTVLTNLERAHLDETGSSLDSSIRATLKVLNHAKPGGTVVVNNDCPYLSKETFDGFRVIRYSSVNNSDSDYWAEEIINNSDSAVFKVYSKYEEPFELEINIPGLHNVTNAVGAYAIGRLYGISQEKIRDAIASFKTSGIRQHLLTLNGRSLLMDCYSITPLSAVAAAKTICGLPLKEKGRRIMVISYLPTLSNESESVHREVGRKLSELPLDIVIGYRNDSKYLVDECKNMGKQAYFFQYHKDVIDFLNKNITVDDNILFKGGTASHLEQIANAVFDLKIKSENTLESDRQKNGGDY